MIREDDFIVNNTSSSENSSESSQTLSSSLSSKISLSSTDSDSLESESSKLSRRNSYSLRNITENEENINTVLEEDQLTNEVFEENTSITSLDNECFICLDSINANQENLIPLNEIVSVQRQCDCNGLVHPTCYSEWIISNMSCPICTKELRFVNYRNYNNYPNNNSRETISQETNINDNSNTRYNYNRNAIVPVNTLEYNRARQIRQDNPSFVQEFQLDLNQYNNNNGEIFTRDKFYEITLGCLGITGLIFLVWLFVAIST